MTTTKTYSLIDGGYEPNEAKELLQEIIKCKINFHKLKNFSSEIRYGKPYPGSAKRIEQLTNAREDILRLIETAKRENKHLSVRSAIEITLEE